MSPQRVTSAHAEYWFPSVSRPLWCPTAVRPLSVSQALRCSLRHQGPPLDFSTRMRGCPASSQLHHGLPKQRLARCYVVSSSSSDRGSSASEHLIVGAASGVAGDPAGQSVDQPTDCTWGDYWHILLPDWSRMLACGAFTLLSVVCTIAVGPAIGQGAPVSRPEMTLELDDVAASDCHAP